MTSRVDFTAGSEADTCRLATLLAAVLPPTLTIGLDGPLGAGKTTFIRALAGALGANERSVASPTFVLVHHYRARTPIYHFDAYRLTSSTEFLELGTEEYFAGPGISLVEWASRVTDCLPADRLDIVIAITGIQARHFGISATGPESKAILARLAPWLA